MNLYDSLPEQTKMIRYGDYKGPQDDVIARDGRVVLVMPCAGRTI